jgi:hypothetical protein
MLYFRSLAGTVELEHRGARLLTSPRVWPLLCVRKYVPGRVLCASLGECMRKYVRTHAGSLAISARLYGLETILLNVHSERY